MNKDICAKERILEIKKGNIHLFTGKLFKKYSSPLIKTIKSNEPFIKQKHIWRQSQQWKRSYKRRSRTVIKRLGKKRQIKTSHEAGGTPDEKLGCRKRTTQ
jgi:hypothetical protein